MELDDFFEKLWFEYPADLCHGKKGSKVAAKNAAKKLKADEYEGILRSMKELIRFDRKDPKPDRWPHVSTWINQAYYDRDIDVQEQRAKIELAQCTEEGCENEVHGSRFNKCTNHLVNEKHYNDLREAWTRTGIDRKSPTLGQDCRTYLRERMGIILSKGEV
jgi:hypothetical protein